MQILIFSFLVLTLTTAQVMASTLRFDPYFHFISQDSAPQGRLATLKTTAINSTAQDIRLIAMHSVCACTSSQKLPILLPAHSSTPIEIQVDTSTLKKTAWITLETDYTILPFYVLSIDHRNDSLEKVGPLKPQGADQIQLSRADFEVSRSKVTDRIPILNPKGQTLKIKKVNVFLDDKKISQDLFDLTIQPQSVGIQIKDADSITGILHGDIEIGPTTGGSKDDLTIGLLGLFFNDSRAPSIQEKKE